MLTKILKNNTAGELTILNRAVPAGGSYPLTVKYWIEAYDNEQLLLDINAGNVVVNDGTTDLSIVDGIALLELFQPDIDEEGTDHHAGWYDIQASEEVIVESRKQMRINGTITITGCLVVDGQAVID